LVSPSSITCRAVSSRYPSGPASSSTPAPKLLDAVSLWENHVRRAGLITATSGFSSCETSVAVNPFIDGNAGKLDLESSSPRLALTKVGKGTNATDNTAPADVRMPLMVKSVERKEIHANRVRGGSPRMANRKTMVNRHRTGRTKTSGHMAIRAHIGTGSASFGSKWLG